ncbi:Uncharacterised protein [Klebsiella pneumoniae]|nr:Uncharacterised protein [Klebsiella pneumoniae]
MESCPAHAGAGIAGDPWHHRPSEDGRCRRRANGAPYRRSHQAGRLPCAMRISPIRAIWMWMYSSCSPRKPCSRWPTASTTPALPPGAAAKARAIPSGWASWITADWQCRLFRVSITSSAAAWYSRTPGSSGKTAGRPSASTRSISWRWPLANSHSTPSTLPPRA